MNTLQALKTANALWAKAIQEKARGAAVSDETLDTLEAARRAAATEHALAIAATLRATS